MVKVNSENIDKWLANGNDLGQPHIEVLSEFTDKYPFYGPTQVLLAKALFNIKSESFEKQLRKAALCTEDRLWLYNFIHQKEVQTIAPKVSSPEVVLPKVEEKKEPVLKKETKKKAPVKAKKVVEKVKSKPKINKVAKSKVPKSEVPKVDKPVKKKPLTKTSLKPPSLKKTPIKKITLSQGEGEVLKSETIPNDALVAKLPRLRIEEEQVNLVAPAEVEIETNITQADNHSFLDWLDYTNFNEESNELSVMESVPDEIDSAPKVIRANNSVEKTFDLLENFIANKPKPGEIKLEKYDPEREALKAEQDEEIPVSETLAQVYLSQEETEMAIEVYRKLMLKFPEKSTYFADLIQKLNTI